MPHIPPFRAIAVVAITIVPASSARAAPPVAPSPPASRAPVAASTDPTAVDDSRFVEDYEFIRDTVARHSAALRRSGLDWDATCARFAPRFASCEKTIEHVRLVMELLATLGDSHTGVTRSAVDAKFLPSKFDGLYGAGMWLDWDRGRVAVRDLLPGHPLAARLPRGSVLTEIAGEPAWLALERQRRRIIHYQGSSSDHSLFASLGNRMIPFGDGREVRCGFLTPSLERIHLSLPRWGPGGKAFSLRRATTPDGIELAEGACSGMLAVPWSEKLGYLRITGSMDRPTARAFHAALDALEGMEALVLDCRGMGGGSDHAAWEMAGRFYPPGFDCGQGRGRTFTDADAWRFDGPIVMLQDALEVSSAETFTWALSETGRAISVGRATGGWGIIPKVFECPSGLVDFRLGVNDRATPLKRIHTEGRGWPADLRVPSGPVFAARPDATFELGLEVVRLLHANVERDALRRSFAALLSGEIDAFRKRMKRVAKRVPGWSPDDLAGRVKQDLQGQIAMELELLTDGQEPIPDCAGFVQRASELVARARRAGMKKAARALEKAARDAREEAAAQSALGPLLDPVSPPKLRAWKIYLKAHRKTRTGQYSANHLTR